MILNLSISNIAWPREADESVAKLLNCKSIRCIDVAPGKYFSELSTVRNKDILAIKNWWAARNISIVGMQSLFYGTTGLNLFNKSTQDTMIQHLHMICNVAATLGAKKLVLGSPKNRDRSALDDSETEDIALDFFYRLGETARQQGVAICLEANPPCYGTNFLCTTPEAAAFIRHLSHPNILLQLDLGTILYNGEGHEVILENRDIIGHVHISVPDLLPIYKYTTVPAEIVDTLRQFFTSGASRTDIATIEMLVDQGFEDEWMPTIGESIDYAKQLINME